MKNATNEPYCTRGGLTGISWHRLVCCRPVLEGMSEPMFGSHGTLAHRKMMAALLGLLFLLGGALAACSSSGSGSLTGSVASIDSAASSFMLNPQQTSANAASVTV